MFIRVKLTAVKPPDAGDIGNISEEFIWTAAGHPTTWPLLRTAHLYTVYVFVILFFYLSDFPALPMLTSY